MWKSWGRVHRDANGLVYESSLVQYYSYCSSVTISKPGVLFGNPGYEKLRLKILENEVRYLSFPVLEHGIY